MMCVFTAIDGRCKCLNCGRIAVSPDCNRTFAECRSKPREPDSCTHFQGFTGESTEAKCGGCQSAKAMTSLAECELFGLVTPISVAKDKTIRSCKGCERYEAS